MGGLTFPSNALFVGTAVKAADELVNNSITLQNDDDLLFSMVTNSKYLVLLGLYVLMGNGGGGDSNLKVSFTGPAGATFQGSLHVVRNDNSEQTFYFTDASATSIVLMPQTTAGIFTVAINVQNGATAGNFQLQWAQNTARVQDDKVKAGSNLVAFKVD